MSATTWNVPTSPVGTSAAGRFTSPPAATAAGAASPSVAVLGGGTPNVTKSGIRLFFAAGAISNEDSARLLGGLQSGYVLKKYGRSGKPHGATVKVSPDLLTISWGNGFKQSAKVLSLTDVKAGRQTKVFTSYFNSNPKEAAAARDSMLDDRCFSLVFADRTLDLEVDPILLTHGSHAVPTAADAATDKKRAILEKWTPAEVAAFEAGFTQFQKNWVKVAAKIGTKNIEETVSFYYIWRETPAGVKLQTELAAKSKPGGGAVAAAAASSAATPMHTLVTRAELVRSFQWLHDYMRRMSEGMPVGVKRGLHVNQEMEWSGSNFETDFERTDLLGEGAFGQVWRAQHRQMTGMVMALKLIPATNAEAVADIRKEIDVLKRCKHPNIVSYYGMHGPDSENRLWILMDYCQVGSVMTLIDQSHTIALTEPQIAFILTSTLNALVYLHSQKIIHRDVKARNILLTADGDVKLADFGVSSVLKPKKSATSPPAAAAAATATATGSLDRKSAAAAAAAGADGGDFETEFAGSPLWMAPEVCDHQPSSYNCDIWSLGMTAIEMAEKKLPYDDWTNPFRIIRAVSSNPPPTLQNVNGPDAWSKDFQSFVERCLIKDPTKRPSASELLAHSFLTRTKTRQHKSILRPTLDQYFANAAAEKERIKKGIAITVDADAKDLTHSSSKNEALAVPSESGKQRKPPTVAAGGQTEVLGSRSTAAAGSTPTARTAHASVTDIARPSTGGGVGTTKSVSAAAASAAAEEAAAGYESDDSQIAAATGPPTANYGGGPGDEPDFPDDEHLPLTASTMTPSPVPAAGRTPMDGSFVVLPQSQPPQQQLHDLTTSEGRTNAAIAVANSGSVGRAVTAAPSTATNGRPAVAPTSVSNTANGSVAVNIPIDEKQPLIEKAANSKSSGGDEDGGRSNSSNWIGWAIGGCVVISVVAVWFVKFRK